MSSFGSKDEYRDYQQKDRSPRRLFTYIGGDNRYEKYHLDQGGTPGNQGQCRVAASGQDDIQPIEHFGDNNQMFVCTM